MRGPDRGALTRTYLHSSISESLWYDVVESELLLGAKLSHAVMLASLYGNPSAGLDKGNEQVHEMYIGALETMPYFRAVSKRVAKGSTDDMVDEWRRVNAGLSSDAQADGKEGDDVRR